MEESIRMRRTCAYRLSLRERIENKQKTLKLLERIVGVATEAAGCVVPSVCCFIMPSKSWVWTHFDKLSDREVAKCRHCEEEKAPLKCKGGSTSNLASHLGRKHEIYCDSPVPQGSQLPLQSSFQLGNDRDGFITKLAVLDNIPFKVIASSTSLRTLIEGYTGQPTPISPPTIVEIVRRKSDEVRATIRGELDSYQSRGGSFSVAFDEATAKNSSHRFLSLNLRAELPNLNVPDSGRDVYLGLIKVCGSATADVISEVIKGRLDSFGVKLNNCDFAITDGASVMKSAVSKLGMRSQLCLIHGLHLAIKKTMKQYLM